MKIAASLLVATLAVASALPNAPLESRDEPKAVGATPVAHPSCALKDKGKYIVRKPDYRAHRILGGFTKSLSRAALIPITSMNTGKILRSRVNARSRPRNATELLAAILLPFMYVVRCCYIRET